MYKRPRLPSPCPRAEPLSGIGSKKSPDQCDPCHRWTGWWYTYPSKKYDFVSWDDCSQCMESHNPVMFQSPPTSPTSVKNQMASPLWKSEDSFPSCCVLNSPRLGSGILSFPGIWIPNVPSRLTNLVRSWSLAQSQGYTKQRSQSWETPRRHAAHLRLMLQVPKLFGLLIFPALLVPAALLTRVMGMGRKTSSWLPGRFEKVRSSQAETLFVGLRIVEDSEHHSDHWSSVLIFKQSLSTSTYLRHGL